MFRCFELQWFEYTKQTIASAVQILISSFDSLLGYSVAVGDFNDDGEDGKILWFMVDILEMINRWDLLNIVLKKWIILFGKGTLNQSQ